MNIIEFKNEVDRLIDYAIECEEPLEEIEVSVQIDDPHRDLMYSNKIELHYDNNCNASGFVVLGIVE